MAPTGPSKNTLAMKQKCFITKQFFEPSLFVPVGAIKKHFELAKLCFAFKQQHPSKTCRFHGMQFFNGPVGGIKTLRPSLFDPYNKWYCK